MDYEPTGPAQQQRPVCDTYFVESMDTEDTGVFATRRSKPDIARMHAETQMEIAEDLSRAVSEEFQEDILDHMEVMEVCSSAHVSPCLCSHVFRMKHCPMLLVSTSRLKFSGSCARISWTS